MYTSNTKPHCSFTKKNKTKPPPQKSQTFEILSLVIPDNSFFSSFYLLSKQQEWNLICHLYHTVDQHLTVTILATCALTDFFRRQLQMLNFLNCSFTHFYLIWFFTVVSSVPLSFCSWHCSILCSYINNNSQNRRTSPNQEDWSWSDWRGLLQPSGHDLIWSQTSDA